MNDPQIAAPPARGADLLALVDVALREAKARGADQAEAAVSLDVGLSVSVRLGEVETVEYQRDRGMGVTVYFGTRKGAASTADLTEEALRETVAKACSIARFTAQDPCAGLADPDTLATEIPDLDLSHPWALDPEAAVELARACESAAMAVDKRITNSDGAGVSSHAGVRAYGNTHGFMAAYPGSLHGISCAVIGVDGAEMQRDYWYSSTRDWRELEPAETSRPPQRRARGCTPGCAQAGDHARARALFARGRARADRAFHGRDPRRQPVPPRVLPARRGRAAGLPDGSRLRERPHLPKALGSAPFDNEGVATRDRDLVTGGVLAGYVIGHLLRAQARSAHDR